MSLRWQDENGDPRKELLRRNHHRGQLLWGCMLGDIIGTTVVFSRLGDLRPVSLTRIHCQPHARLVARHRLSVLLDRADAFRMAFIEFVLFLVHHIHPNRAAYWSLSE